MKKRIWLSVVLLGIIASSITCEPADSKMTITRIVDQNREQLVQAVRELVQINSVKAPASAGAPFGAGVSKALDKMLTIARSQGFETVNLDGYVGYVDYGAGDDYIAVLTHLDVVDAGEGWTHPPFAGEVREGKIFGRGTVDDKGPAVASLFALKAVRDARIPLSKKVRLIFGTDDETDVADIPYYLERENPPVAGFTPDGFYPVINAEKGRLQFHLIKNILNPGNSPAIISLNGGMALNSVPEYARVEITTDDPDPLIRICKEFIDKRGYNLKTEFKNGMLIINSRGKAVHASMPETGQNAIMRLLAVIHEFPHAPSDISDAVSFMVDKIGEEIHGESLGIGLRDDVSGALTLVVSTISLENNLMTIGFDIRYPVTYTTEQVLAKLKLALDGTGFRIEIITDERPLYFPTDTPLVTKLLNIYREQTGRDDKPLAIGGASYARDIPNILVFGPVFPEETYQGHTTDESISIDQLIMNTKIFANAIVELAK